ncbi:sigma 54-interacting transcriptional regulator [Tetragenococcus koreensis]|uniref:sigma 54-interacting transcriptional regulator n=1 Tax=Tetragenococcus koreensis TaxID=290335 RepID=UPI000F516B36|nr:sigma 54-interacting transcriptional regulator [Tetragenococcus koreensis]AYW44839.1 RNA polymerase subunit sigma-54 [Tetragenococcus koreensis]GEN90410.1 transcriptional antiterminator [Tetragenococcus koreensis]
MKIKTRQDLLAALKKGKPDMTTTEIAEAVKLSRSVTSLYLNELLANGEVIKKGSKPIYWQLADFSESKNAEDIFQKFIGSNGSVKEAINKCKAAVLYPPLGLPLLIHGDSGVGKSYLAKLIFEYLKAKQVNGTEKFLVFNCADYANNPELISSILFGHTKGAFTGADSAKKGLLAQADQGVLFLDEVHRLSHENQEKLFQFMDTGHFRPIGEEEKTVTSNVRLLFATTEKPEKVLLPTFYRRISVTIHLPSFHQRPIFERIELIKYLFLNEAKRIKKDLKISQRVFSKMTEEKLSGNVGSLTNEVRMLCADMLRKNNDEEVIKIGEPQEKDWIYLFQTDSIFDEKTQAIQKLSQSFSNLFNKDIDFPELKKSIYQFNQDFLTELFSSDNDCLFYHIKNSIQNRNKNTIDNEPLTEEAVYCLYNVIKLNENNDHAEKLGKVKQQLVSEYPRTVALANNLTKDLNQEIKEFAETILAILLIDSVSEDIRYHALLVAHGNSTASSIQAVTNRLCGDYVFDAINMPLTSSIRDIISQVKIWLSERDTSQGVVMLVDMGSLTQLYKSLKPQILGELLVINNLTTSYALDIGQKLLNGKLFYDIAKSAENNFKTEVQYFEGFEVEKNIIISSISGKDVAKKIQSICQKYLDPDVKLIVLKFNELLNTLELAHSQQDYLESTVLVLSTSYLDNKTEIPTINLLDVVDEDAETKLEQSFKNLIHPNDITNILNEFIQFFSKEGLSEKLVFLNPDVIIRQVEDVVEKLERRFNLKLSAKMRFNLLMHSALLIERTILGVEDYSVPENIDEIKINGRLFYQNAKNVFYSLEQFYKIQISDWELYVIYELLIS